MASLLFSHVSARGLGEMFEAPVDVILGRHTIVQPDIVFVERAGLGIVAERGIEGPPTLAVEILSASTTRIHRATKFHLYTRFGVPHYWKGGAHGLRARRVQGKAVARGAQRI